MKNALLEEEKVAAGFLVLTSMHIHIHASMYKDRDRGRERGRVRHASPTAPHIIYSMYAQGTETETEAEAERERQRHAPRPYRTSETNRMYVYTYNCILYICHMLYGHAKGGDQRS